MPAPTLLQLTNKLIQECGVSGGPISTIVGVQGSILRCVGWVQDAWNELQLVHDDWGWMRASNILGSGASFVPSAGQYQIAMGTAGGQTGIAVDSFGKWDRETFRNYTTAVGTQNEMFMDDLPFDTYRDSYIFGAMRAVQTRPVVVSIAPDGQTVCVGPPSNGLYTVTADYFLAPVPIVDDADIPSGLPTRFGLLPVYMAMMKYGAYEAAMDVYERGFAQTNTMMDQLEAVRMGVVTFGGALEP